MAGRAHPDGAKDAGFTLIELLVVMVIASVLFGISATGFVGWRNTSQHQGTADELVSQLRNASERAISEGRTYCVDIAADGRSYSLYRFACSSTASIGTKVNGPYKVKGNEVTLIAAPVLPTTPPPCPAGSECLYFFPRGTALESSIVVASTARPHKTYTVRVEGLTARVYK